VACMLVCPALVSVIHVMGMFIMLRGYYRLMMMLVFRVLPIVLMMMFHPRPPLWIHPL
jgi:hypothetical protein